MAEAGNGSIDRKDRRLDRNHHRRRRPVMKPVGWPRYLVEKQLKGGGTAYYWNPPVIYLRAGFTLHREALGPDYGHAVARATMLNAQLDAWRAGRVAENVPEAQPTFGTVGWMFDHYRRSQPYQQ